MQAIIQYLGRYLYDVNKTILFITVSAAAILIFLNYYFEMDQQIAANPFFLFRFITRYFIYLAAFLLPYLLLLPRCREPFRSRQFIILLLLAPALFSLKTGLSLRFNLVKDFAQDYYWQTVIYWPLLAIIMTVLLLITWRLFHPDQFFYGIKTKNISWRPYWVMLLIMIPLVAAASTQKDFLQVYPKMKMISGFYFGTEFNLWQKFLFELAYGSDFLSIELFFRGFLILGFIKWAGKDSILPMALFYCTVHFGKPMGECISSFFGGLLLGVVVYHTRSIFGGLIVHLGIAWLMEIGGYIGNQLFNQP